MYTKKNNLTTLEFWTRDPDEPGWILDHIRTGSNLRWAELCATDLLATHKIYETRYNVNRALGRAPYCVARTPDGKRTSFDPKVEIVPSVGELGYW